MSTFAFIVHFSLFINNVHVHTDDLILDRNMSFGDCAQLLSNYDVNAQQLSTQMSVHQTVSCAKED
jgi:hypothetical protein